MIRAIESWILYAVTSAPMAGVVAFGVAMLRPPERESIGDVCGIQLGICEWPGCGEPPVVPGDVRAQPALAFIDATVAIAEEATRTRALARRLDAVVRSWDAGHPIETCAPGVPMPCRVAGTVTIERPSMIPASGSTKYGGTKYPLSFDRVGS